MFRTKYIPHDEDREEQKVEERAEARRTKDEPIDYRAPDWRFGDLDPNVPEFDSIEGFAESLFEDDREEFTCQELACLNARHHTPVHMIRLALEDYGLRLQHRPKERSFRGVRSNPYTRYAGNPMCATSGGNAILGLA